MTICIVLNLNCVNKKNNLRHLLMLRGSRSLMNNKSFSLFFDKYIYKEININAHVAVVEEGGELSKKEISS